MPGFKTPRLILKDFWEDVRRALPIADTSRAALLKAQKRGDLKNLTLIGDNAGDRDDKKQSEFPITLGFKPVFFDSYNVRDAWTADTSGTTDYWSELANL